MCGIVIDRLDLKLDHLPSKEERVKRQSLAKLLAQVDPTVHCDLCPSFHVDIIDQRLDVRIHLDEGDQRWYVQDADVKNRLRQRFHDLEAVGINSVQELEAFKLGAAQALIQEVQAGCLFKDGVTDEGGEVDAGDLM